MGLQRRSTDWQPRPQHHEHDQGYIGRFFNSIERNAKAIVALGTVVLAAFTVILAIATAFLGWATHALVKGAEATAERQLRAYLSFSEAAIENFGTEKPLKATLRVKNCGQTPAYEVRDWIQFAIQPFPYEEIDSGTDSAIKHIGWYPSRELSRALAQAMHYLQVIEDHRLQLVELVKIPVLRPTITIVIGRSNDWEEPMRNQLRILNSTLLSIKILTYDHLLAMGNNILQLYAPEADIPI